jgi:cytoskeletal protein CcmA (bactofilin family)
MENDMIRFSWTPKACRRTDSGTVLVSMLAVMAALMIIFLVALTIAVAAYSRHVRANNRLTASFLADSGIQRCRLATFSTSPRDVPNCWQTPNNGSVCTRIYSWGPTRLAFAEGTFANQQVTTAALLGAPLPTPLIAAITVTNPDYPLVVSGTTTIVGNIITGPLGVTPGRFQGEDLTNERYHIGNVLALPQPPVLELDSSVLNGYFRDMEIRRGQCRKRLSASPTLGHDDSQLWQDNRSILVENNAFIDGLTFDRHDSIYSLFVDGRIEISGSTQIRGTIEITSNSYILVGDSALIDQALLYAEDSIVIEDAARFSGIAISPHRIIVRDKALLQYPAMLVVNAPSDSCSDSCGIFLRTSVPAEASCVVVIASHSNRVPEPTILVDSNVTVIGTLLSRGVVDLRGTIRGSVWTSAFRFYAPPTTYINWLRNSRIDRSKLTFVPPLPVLAADSIPPHLRIVWQEEAK